MMEMLCTEQSCRSSNVATFYATFCFKVHFTCMMGTFVVGLFFGVYGAIISILSTGVVLHTVGNR